MIEIDNSLIIIPARMASTRLPGKPLADICGLPMIVQVWKRAIDAKIGRVLVAAAEAEIASVIIAQGGDAIVTNPALPSGSDRVAEAVALRDPQRNFQFIVNLQGDLPNIEPLCLQRCLAGLVNDSVDIATIAAPLRATEDQKNQHIVKAIAPLSAEREVAFARDFVREIPEHYLPPYWHHIGVYAYRRVALERFIQLPASARETERRLEQMRALDNGMKIAVVRVDGIPLSVDTPADLEAARHILKDCKAKKGTIDAQW